MAGDPVKGDTSSLSALVKDWGGFELLVAKLNETGNVTVEHNVTLPGRSGAPRQIDVLIRHKQGLIEHLVVAECKYRNQPIERLHVDALATTVREVGASKGVIFSTRGFQSGAITQAKHDAIDLFLVREPTDEEWGSPGRIVDFTLLCYQPVIGRIVPGQAWGLDGINEPLSINILIGLSAEDSSQTKIINSPNDETLEKLIIDNVRRSVQGMLPKGRVIQDGSYEVEIRGRSYLNMNFDPPRMMTTGGRTFAMPSIMLEIGFTATQTRFAIDRAESLLFALAVEDCVSSTVMAASREKSGNKTDIYTLKPEIIEGEEPYQNGSILQILVAGFAAFSELSDVPENRMIVRPKRPSVVPA